MQAAESDSESMEDEEEVRPTKKRKQVFRNVEKAMKQPELKVYWGANIPFSSAEVERLREQFLRATSLGQSSFSMDGGCGGH